MAENNNKINEAWNQEVLRSNALILQKPAKRNIVWHPAKLSNILGDSDSGDGIHSGSSRLLYVVVNLKIWESAIAKIARSHGCGSKMSLEQDLDLGQSIGEHLKLYYGSVKRTPVNFKGK